MREYEKTGILSIKDLQVPKEKELEKGVAILECVQEIPCNPCVESCPVHAISMKDINAPPVNDFEKCIGCTEMRRCLSWFSDICDKNKRS